MQALFYTERIATIPLVPTVPNVSKMTTFRITRFHGHLGIFELTQPTKILKLGSLYSQHTHRLLIQYLRGHVGYAKITKDIHAGLPANGKDHIQPPENATFVAMMPRSFCALRRVLTDTP